MGRTCCVPMCTSGYKSNKEKVSLFKVPPDRLEVWRNHIRRKDRMITTRDLVCEKHFCPEYIVRQLVTECYTIPLEKCKLTPDAIPTIFFKCNKRKPNKKQLDESFNYIPPKMMDKIDEASQILENNAEESSHNLNCLPLINKKIEIDEASQNLENNAEESSHNLNCLPLINKKIEIDEASQNLENNAEESSHNLNCLPLINKKIEIDEASQNLENNAEESSHNLNCLPLINEKIEIDEASQNLNGDAGESSINFNHILFNKEKEVDTYSQNFENDAEESSQNFDYIVLDKIKEIDEAPQNLDNDAEKDSCIAASDDDNLFKTPFQYFCNKKDRIILPSPSWKLEIFENVMVIYNLKVVCNNVVMEKKLIITEEDMRIFVYENICEFSALFKSPVNTVEDLEEFLKVFEKLIVCPGGVCKKEIPINFDSSKAYKKDKIAQCWRHSNCTLIAINNKSCEWCKNFNNAVKIFIYRIEEGAFLRKTRKLFKQKQRRARERNLKMLSQLNHVKEEMQEIQDEIVIKIEPIDIMDSS